MSQNPNQETAASKLISSMMGNTRPRQTLPRQTIKLSRQSLLNEINDIYRQGNQTLYKISAIRYALQKPEVATHTSLETIKKLGTVLATDLKIFGERLNDIKKSQDASSNISDDGEFHLEMLRIGDEYAKWMTELTQIVIPTYESLGTLLNSVFATDTTPDNPE